MRVTVCRVSAFLPLLALLLPSAARADVTGRVAYESVPSTTSGLNYALTTARPVRGARVLLVDATASSTLAETATDGNGAFSLPAAGGQAKLVIVAQTVDPPIVVKDNTDSDQIWAVETAAFSGSQQFDLTIPSGWTGGGYDAASRLSAPFAILDAMWEAAQAFRAVRSVAFPQLLVNWSPDNRSESGDKAAGQITTSHWDGQQLYILGKENVDTDEFDSHVIVHEWGHYFESFLSRSDSVGGSHGSGDLLDMRVAFGEGWGNAVSAMALYPDSVYTDTLGSGQSRGFGFDLEDNGGDPRPGWFSEASIQSILYDIFDPNDDGVDHVSLGLGPIYDALAGPQRSTPALTSIFSFAWALGQVDPGSVGGVDQLLMQHSIMPVRDPFGDDETNDAGYPDNLPIYRLADIGGAPVTLTLHGEQDWNWVGQNRFVAVIGNGSSVTATATTNQDVSLTAVANGNVLDYSDRFYSGTETVQFTTASGGLYILAIGGFPAGGAYTCTVQVTAP
jgi:hypothetical protein